MWLAVLLLALWIVVLRVSPLLGELVSGSLTGVLGLRGVLRLLGISKELLNEYTMKCALYKLTLAVPHRRALLVARAESRREQVHRIADYSLAAGNSAAAADHSSRGFVAVKDSLAADSHSDRSFVAEHRTGPVADLAGSPGCIGRMGLTWCLCEVCRWRSVR